MFAHVLNMSSVVQNIIYTIESSWLAHLAIACVRKKTIKLCHLSNCHICALRTELSPQSRVHSELTTRKHQCAQHRSNTSISNTYNIWYVSSILLIFYRAHLVPCRSMTTLTYCPACRFLIPIGVHALQFVRWPHISSCEWSSNALCISNIYGNIVKRHYLRVNVCVSVWQLDRVSLLRLRTTRNMNILCTENWPIKLKGCAHTKPGLHICCDCDPSHWTLHVGYAVPVRLPLKQTEMGV